MKKEKDKKEKKQVIDYFEMLSLGTKSACEATKILRKIINNPNDLESLIDKMHEVEHDADVKNHQTYSALNNAFMTPIEREDILLLTDSIDDVVDTIEDIAIRFHMFHITKMRPEAIEFVEIISNACDALKKAMSEFRYFKKSKVIIDLLIEINNIEEQGNRLYRKAVHTLFKECSDAVEILKWCEIYETMEACCDACEDVANAIQSVIMKNT